MNTASFNHFKIVHRTAREFTDATSQNQGKVALQVNGHGAHRTTAFASDTVDVSWFVDQNIMWGDYSPPAQGARLIPPFGFAGMDVNGSFALPLETGYRRHIIEFTP